jgi:hypothetical protein
MLANIEHDHYPEIVENKKGTRRLELLGIKEQLREPQERRKMFAAMTDEQFTKMVGYVNSITRGEKIEYDYKDGKLSSGTYTPALEDKAHLMDLAFESVREIASNSELDDKTALREAGLTFAGAMNYIHPKEDGNGRTGRVLHYLVEFGTERGDEAFNEEMYAVIGKLPIYDKESKLGLHPKLAIDDTPPSILERALDNRVQQSEPEHFSAMDGQELASARVVAFLDMMRGETKVPIDEAITRWHGSSAEGTHWVEEIAPGEIDGLGLYEKDYLDRSAVPSRLPDQVPEGAQRVLAKKESTPSKVSRRIIDRV